MMDGFSWFGIYTDEGVVMRDFMEEACGGLIVHQTQDFWVFDFPNGHRMEVFGPHGPRPAHLKKFQGGVLGFAVADMEEAKRHIQRRGCQLLGDTEVDGAYQWQHFRAPDGQVFELTSDTREHAPPPTQRR